MGFMDRLWNGWDMAYASWQVIFRDKSLLLFPVISFLAQLVIIAMYAGAGDPFGLIKLADSAYGEEAGGGAAVLAGIVFFVIAFFFNSITIFFNVALISCAKRSLQGEDTTVGQGLSAAFGLVHLVLLWSLISTVVSSILNAIESNEKAGAILRMILGTAWSIITYFVLPVLVFEKVGPIEAIKRSTSIIRQTWGESIGGYVGTGIIGFVAALPGIALCFLAAISSVWFFAVIGLLWIIAASLMSTAAASVIRVALYMYAQNETIPASFQNRVQNVFHD